MTTKPKNDAASIVSDAQRVLDAAREDQHDATFAKRVSKHDLDIFAANIAALSSDVGARTGALHVQVAAGVHAAQTRATLFTAFENIRDDAKLSFPKDTALQHAFGVGATPSPGSATQLRVIAELLLDSAAKDAAEAKKIGLDAHGIRHLEDLVHAMDGADLAHHHTATSRHTESTATDSLAHLVAAEAAHIRLGARRVFRGDDTRLARYATTLPRHEVVHRTKPVPAPAPAPSA